MKCAACVLLLSSAMAFGVEVPHVKLNDGGSMPAIALGTYLGIEQADILKSKDKPVRAAILRAIEEGYRHIDTAAIYETEAEIGAALRMVFENGIVKREDLFLTTKLWNTHHKREEVPKALRNSLQKLGVEYVDLYLIHWPMGLNEDYSYSNVDIMETWKGMEDVAKLGLARSIGVSNFNREQMERLIREAATIPSALEIEIHPQMVQQDLVSFCQSRNITVMGYSPFGTLVPRFGISLPGPKLGDPGLVSIAGKYGKTTAQVVLRWQVDRNIVPIAKSLNPRRLKENINIFDFQLTAEEMDRVSSKTTFRLIEPSFWQDHKDYPFEKAAMVVPNPFLKQ